MSVDTGKYEAVIGLEVHAQLLTDSKLFCGCRNEYGLPPNSLTCPVCLGHPGTLPVLNEKAVEYAVKVILAVNGEVQLNSTFARKNYFYPDLPKGYQISQYDRPLGLGGSIRCDSESSSRDININRIHLEEDAGKLLHPENGGGVTRVDFNRCGVPLIEIVSEPEIHTPREAHSYLNKLRRILRYLGVCSGDMEKGALRCDANISLRPAGQDDFGVRTELKNLNSFRAVEKALTHEIERQSAILDSGREVSQMTLLWNERQGVTEILRQKEESEDYRYFPEPDLPELTIDGRWLSDVRKSIPELPHAKKDRFIRQYGLPEYNSGVLTSSRDLADYFEAVAGEVTDKKMASNWVMSELLGAIKDQGVDISDFSVGPKMLAGLLQKIETMVITGKIAKQVFADMVVSSNTADQIIREKNLSQIVDKAELKAIIKKVLDIQTRQVQLYREGKKGLFDFFVGQVMMVTGGRANPELVGKLLKEILDG